MNKELERAQDMLTAMQEQRDNALNAMVHAQAAIAGLRRELTASQTQADQFRAERDALVIDKADLQTQLSAATTIPASDSRDLKRPANGSHPGVPAV